MKKILSVVLVLSIALTMVVSAFPVQAKASVPLNEVQIIQTVGGASVWLCVGGAAIAGVGIASVFVTGGWTLPLAIYSISSAFVVACGS